MFNMIIEHSIDGNAKKSVFRIRLEGILRGIVNSVKETSLEAISESAFSLNYFFHITNCDRSHGWEPILRLIEQGTPTELRDILGKPSISHDDFLTLPLITKNHRQPGVYLNYVVDEDGNNAIYIGSTSKRLIGRVHEHEKLIRCSQPLKGT